MKKFLITIFTIFLSLSAFANEDTLALIDKALKAQESEAKETKALYLEIGENLNTLTQSGVKNANIYTMQGNAYLFANKIGMAIYSYRNALKFDSHNEEILNNLDYARSLCANEEENNKNLSMIESYFYDTEFTKNNALWIFLLAWNLIFIIPLIKTSISEIKFLWIVSIFLAAIFGSSLFYTKYLELNYSYAVVNVSDTVARKGASDIFVPAYKESLKDGKEFLILGKKNNWIHAKLKDGSSCWINKNHTIEL